MEAIQPTTGDGSSSKPYQITSAAELLWFAGLVNGDSTVCTGKVSQNTSACAKLVDEIDLSGICNSTNVKSWTPIGNSSNNKYTGTFDGNGKTISGLYINNSDSNYQGLFGYVGSGTVEDLAVEGNVTGKKYVGGIVGHVSGGKVSGCQNNCSVSGTQYVGGVVGFLSGGTVSKCQNTAGVKGGTSQSPYAGGVVGYVYNSGSVTACSNTGTVGTSNNQYSGGIVGNLYNGTVSSCWNNSVIYGQKVYSGAIVGSISSGTVEKCYYVEITTTDASKQAVGSSSESKITSATVTNKTEDQFKSGEVCYLLNGSSSETVTWYQTLATDSSTGDSYPVLDSTHKTVYAGYTSSESCSTATWIYSNSASGLTTEITHGDLIYKYTATKHWQVCSVCWKTVKSESEHSFSETSTENETCSSCVCGAKKPSGKGTNESPYKIDCVESLQYFAALVNGTGGLTSDPDACATLTATIDLSTVCSASLGSWTPIGTGSIAYVGTFDGGNYTISNLYISDTGSTTGQKLGLFGYVGSGGTVENLTVTGTVSGHQYVGGVVGYLDNGTVSGCRNECSVRPLIP